MNFNPLFIQEGNGGLDFLKAGNIGVLKIFKTLFFFIKFFWHPDPFVMYLGWDVCFYRLQSLYLRLIC